MIKGYIFDLDGVITDTAEYHYQTWKQIADEEGIAFTREDNDALRGVSRRRSLELMLKGRSYPEDKMQGLLNRKNDYFREYMRAFTHANLLPGVAALITEAKAAGIKIGLASASENARELLRKLNIYEQFDVVGDAFSVVNPKPAPDLFIWVAGGLGLSPAECVVFEDADTGILAAKSAGFWTVGIGAAERVGMAHKCCINLAARQWMILPRFKA